MESYRPEHYDQVYRIMYGGNWEPWRQAYNNVSKQEKITLWTGVEDNGSIQDGDGTIGHGLTMDIAKGLSIP